MYILTGFLFGTAILCASKGMWVSAMVFAILTIICFKVAQVGEQPNGE